jgi:hypothetical protein
MANNDELKIKLWILRLFLSLDKLTHSKIVTSIIMFFLPIVCIGYYLQVKYQFHIFTYGVTIALSWTAVAPLLIYSALHTIHEFLNSHKEIFQIEDEWKEVYRFGTDNIQSKKHVLFGIPWAISTSTVIYLIKFTSAPIPIQIWAVTSYFILFFISSIGFYGIFYIISLIKKICASQIYFNPGHPDNFGGISSFGGLAVKGTLYFSSGAMVFPLVFELLQAKAELNIIIWGYASFAMFLLTLILSFLFPIFDIKKFADDQKEKIVLRSWDKLSSMVNSHMNRQGNDLKSTLDIAVYYFIQHLPLYRLKNYPWDLKVLIQFLLSFMVPILIAVLQILLKSNVG